MERRLRPRARRLRQLNPTPTLVCLHYLGGSRRTWAWLEPLLAPTFRVLPLDLPGFGDDTSPQDHSVQSMTTAIAATIRAEIRGPWTLVGHSMGAKVAAVLARQAEDGHLPALQRLILVAGSPPCPEPIPDARRQTMLSWFTGDLPTSRHQAAQFVYQNTARPLDSDKADRAIADLLRMDRTAWQAWLTSGSREDWSARIGILQTPTLIVAGQADEDLGPAAQQALAVPHFARQTLVTIPGAGHLIPLERPDDLAHLMMVHPPP